MENENPIDHAQVVLDEAPITLQQKSDAWDAVYSAPNADELARQLDAHNLPAYVVGALLTAKRLIDTEHPAPSHADRVTAAMHAMARIDPQVLSVAEKHPTILKHLLGDTGKKD